MDKSTQLHELARLKPIDKEHKVAVSKNEKYGQREQYVKQEIVRGKESDDQAKCHKKYGVIFINPNKIHSGKQTDCKKNTQLINQSSSPSTKSCQSVNKTKIYLNPNFKKSALPSIQNDRNQRKENPANIGCNNTIVHPGISSFDKNITRLKIGKGNEESNHRMSNEPSNSHINKTIQKIYVNQHFAKPASEEKNYYSKAVHQIQSDDSGGIGCQNVSPISCQLRHCTQSEGVPIKITSSNEGLSSDFYKKTTTNIEDTNKMKESLRLENVTKYQKSNTMIENKIFINPTFKKRPSGSTAGDSGGSTRNKLNVYESRTSLVKDLKHSCLNSLTKDIIDECNQKNESIIKSTSSHSIPDYGHGYGMTVHNKNTAGQRTRTGSTSLVSISATKVVRRRKSNLKIEPHITSSSNKLLFLSKTKLVRSYLLKNGKDHTNNAKNKFVKNDTNLKKKLKSLVTKNNLHRLAPDKLNKLNGHLLSSDLNMIDESRCVTKIKSNNGKSLQLITSNKESNECEKPSVFTSTLNQPLFISKTKLVRKSEPGKVLNNGKAIVKNTARSDIELKSRTSLVVPKSHLHYLTLQKINHQRKQNALSSRNILNNVSKLPHVTKIRSNNGKSLKLIQNNEVSQRNLMASTSGKYSSVLKRKQLLQQQMKMCMLRNKSRKSQFSKINVLSKKISSVSPCHGKYVYKSKDQVISRRQLTRAAVLKRRSFVQASLPTDKTKYTKSKYNLIKKYSYHHNSSALKGNTNKFPCKLESRLQMKWRKQNTPSKTHCKRKQLSIVNIGGVFYQCSRTSLTRNKPRPSQVLQKSNDGTILHIHGQKFKLERNGLTLTCLDKNPKRKRVDIGGVTFISSSSGTSLTRTNYHTARSILVHAKQKRISLLTRKLKKNNEPCLFFHRFGKCSGKERGTCVRQHDPKNVAVCKKFVQGSCTDGQCLLSHTISCHNMPTCLHFLAGHCSRDHCLYPHIKVSDSAPICLDFLKGYCQLGDQCTKRHRDICPSFEKGVCSRGKYCPYPHPKSMSGKSLSRLTILRKQKPSRDAEMVSNANLRYFDDVNLQKEIKQEQEENLVQLMEECITEEEQDRRLFRNRPKLGRLPSFIPLTDDGLCS